MLRETCENNASDVHLRSGDYPYVREHGKFRSLTQYSHVSSEDMLTMAFGMVTNRRKQKFKASAELDTAYGAADLRQIRVNVFQ